MNLIFTLSPSSIGSLGKGKSESIVSDVFVNRARLTGTTNGVRIKTWQVNTVDFKFSYYFFYVVNYDGY